MLVRAGIVAADNRLSDLGGYDDRELFELLDGIDDLAGTGYDDRFLAELRRDLFPVEPLTDPDDAPALPGEAVSRPGQVWQLGEHRLLVGDATDLGAVERLCDVVPDCVWTDPPYGVNYVGKTKDALTIQNDGVDTLSALLEDVFAVAAAVARPGAPVYIAGPSGPQFGEFHAAMTSAGISWRQTLVWVKDVMVMGRSDYHYKHEAILYGFTPQGKGRLGRGGERWFGGNNQVTVFAVDRPSRSSEHPTMKPVALIDAMLANSLPAGGVVLDPFAGSGSTLIAAHGRGCRAFCVEIDPRYADVILARFEAHTGVVPLLDGKPVSFVPVAA